MSVKTLPQPVVHQLHGYQWTDEPLDTVSSPEWQKISSPYGIAAADDHKQYRLDGKLADAEGLAAAHGYKLNFAGGRYGKPDLAAHNHGTGHITVFDPGAADFKSEGYSKAWRTLHELAHALTLKEVNSIYGDGKRRGKLGHGMSTRDAMRAIHWEWLACHKQRELAGRIGAGLNDLDFNRELNGVMADSLHRVITGALPAGSEFRPHYRHLPLNVAMGIIRERAHHLGLRSMHETSQSFPGKEL